MREILPLVFLPLRSQHCYGWIIVERPRQLATSATQLDLRQVAAAEVASQICGGEMQLT